MKQLRMLRAAVVFVLCGILVSAGKAAPVQIPWSAALRNVQIDGVMDEKAWDDALLAKDFTEASTHQPAIPATEARLFADAQFLYVGLTCHEPQMDKLVHRLTGRQDSLWQDDCVEVFLDPTNSGAWMYHWVINPNGALWEGLHVSGSGSPQFKSHAISAARMGDGEWSCELKIPWKDLMTAPVPGQVIGINFGRERKAGGANALSSWSPSAGSFTDPDILAPAMLGKRGAVEVHSLGSGAVDFNGTGMNQFSAAFTAADLPAQMEVKAKDTVIARKIVDQAGISSIDYTLQNASPLTFKISHGTKVLFTSTLVTPKPTARVWQIPDPLFKPLLSKGKPGLAREGTLMWAHNMSNPNVLRQAARRFGARYVLEDMYRMAGEKQMRLFGAPPSLTNEGSQYWKKYGVKYVYMVARGKPWVIDPRAVEDSLTQLDEQLTRAGKYMWAISASDEVIHRARIEGADLMAKPPQNYSYIHEADKEVREQFGGGKWGIPHGQDDPNPYRWIAFNKWLNVKFHERAQRIRAVIKRHHLDIKMVSFDPQSRVSGNDYSVIKDDYDVFTHQVLQSPNQWRADAGFFTKYLADLTGKDIWPCVHVENYGYATTPRETNEQLSEVFRNGGSGFHFYLPDTANGNKVVGDTRLAYFGSPRRYKTITNIIDLTRTMPPLKFPSNTRTAILYNDDTLQSTFKSTRVPWYATQACYTFLGPVARSWFSFIDDSKVLSSKSLKAKYDTIYIPIATYQRPEIVACLRAFVQAGGTLICGDASAFGEDTLGNDTQLQRQEIFGVQTAKKTTPKVLSVRLNQKSYTLPVSSAVQFIPDKDTRVLGKFEDGSVAITEHRLGRGRAILFAANPFDMNFIADANWREFFKTWAACYNAPVDLDIWRFQFPESVLGKDIPVPPGKCLTNNHVTWREEKPVTVGNVNLNGKYQLQPLPDEMSDEAADAQGWITFDKGHLTDRRKSMLAPKVEPKWYVGFKSADRRWMDSWKSTSAVTLTFDLQKPVLPGTVKMWFDNTMPAFVVQGSNDGKNWQDLGRSATPQEAGNDVKDVTVSLKTQTPFRYVRCVFEPRQEGQKLSLVECEVWGDH